MDAIKRSVERADVCYVCEKTVKGTVERIVAAVDGEHGVREMVTLHMACVTFIDPVTRERRAATPEDFTAKGPGMSMGFKANPESLRALDAVPAQLAMAEEPPFDPSPPWRRKPRHKNTLRAALRARR